MWVKIAGPFPTLEEAIAVRDSGDLKHETNTSGRWSCARGGNARRRLSKCAHATHGDCPVRVCICLPRSGESGVSILVDANASHTAAEQNVPAWDIIDSVRNNIQGAQDGGIAVAPARRFVKMSAEKKAFAMNIWRRMPSAEPREVLRIFQLEAKERGAKLRVGRNAGYEGAHAYSIVMLSNNYTRKYMRNGVLYALAVSCTRSCVDHMHSQHDSCICAVGHV